MSQRLDQHMEIENNINEQEQGLDKRLILIMAIACAIAVGNLYYSQPILTDIGRTFHVAPGLAGWIATVGQLGYALGLLFLVPLGDRYDRRTLIVSLLGLVTIALIGMATAPSFILVILASFVVSFTTIVPQIIIPFAASLTPAKERGRTVGTIMSGLIIGILIARTFSGFISTHLGWRAVYWIAAALMIMLGITLRFLLPKDRPHQSMSYRQLMKSLGNIVRTQPALRESSIFGALVFGAFSAFWVNLGFFLETPPYHFGSDVTGLFGLVGVAGALAANVAGKQADRRDVRQMIGIALGLILLAFLILWFTGYWLVGLIIGVILLDLGTQGNQITNQARIYSLNVDAPSRLNTAYMVTYFAGGALGSFLGTSGWSLAGWNGVCGSACLMILCALALYFFNSWKMKSTKAILLNKESSINRKFKSS